MSGSRTPALAWLGAALLVGALAVAGWIQLQQSRADIVRLKSQVVELEKAVKVAQAATEAARAVEAAARAEEAAAKAELKLARTAARTALLRQRALAKAKRIASLAPIAGAAIAVWFEEREYKEWRADHPEIDNDLQARKAYYGEAYGLVLESLEQELADWKRNHPQAWQRLMRGVDEYFRRTSEAAPGS